MAAMHKSVHGVKTTEELYSCFPEPDPDYDGPDVPDEEEESGDFPPPPPPLTAEQLSEAVSQAHDSHVANGDIASASDDPASGEEPGMIRPKPLANPCVESRERQALHKELLMNYKIGKDILQKPELNKVLRERRETQRKKEWDEQKVIKDRSSLELKLQERANRMKEEEEKGMKVIQEDTQAPEFVRMHRKITKPGNETEQS
ncbi:protein FAM107B [Aplysia californica]|uniref:Protein FAM107B n=1 Tax=Aplysia californica TaxID=6500 RepID=A0ABM0JMT6_APLCA|nr:protein FAM107B [Aplysia californica]